MPQYLVVLVNPPSTLKSTRKYCGDALSEKEIDQDIAPRNISVLAQGRYPGSQDLAYRLPMNWGVHSDTTDPDQAMPKTGLALIRPHLLTVAGAAQASWNH